MKNEVRYVFDTNALISALLFENSKPAQALRYALANGEVLVSLDLLEELNEVLGREKFNRYLTTEEREEFLEALIERAVLVDVTENVQECRDPKDDKVLELALNGEAQYIISGDRDLLVLHPFRDVLVITADEFLKTIESR
ncbi:putative toxin-antitoxin system toxin component, PIN family [Oscillatoria sp. CS-180]|uniref:putative toxin-antitoxin system toxin component, PIN family n=1 Tax=Oscillatoria sp. CS-180 TaxID=3021720 RepID=UPI0023311251|nr:putative toxin-antitoxin system toxin component, PIN family [Oscillatoria sp. CS-180]MDB9529364.1 putative toxin-antitoxin system toxin component, PIN family [Oscillatoria sp. CS-180]